MINVLQDEGYLMNSKPFKNVEREGKKNTFPMLPRSSLTKCGTKKQSHLENILSPRNFYGEL